MRTADAKDGRRGEAIAALIVDIAQCFFGIRALGQKSGLITTWGGGAFGFLRSLDAHGPLTVPQIAEMRPTSRQRMQRLADELAAEGLVEFVDNPKHQRSRLVRLTRKGAARYQQMAARLLELAATMGGELTESEIRRTSAIVRLIGDEARNLSSRRLSHSTPRVRHLK
ncbi:MAG TPA: MarR family transcriptional regulator [Vicinamibacterales bacterium]|nr:MarR family transcriptional regulator [Vicinamibacterales bacterium]